MKALYAAVILGLFALSPQALAGDDKPLPKCVNDVFEDPDDEAMAESLKDTERPLHAAGVKLITNFVCQGGERCLAKHGDRLAKAANTVVDVCLSEPGIPKYMCLGFVANISNEGGGLEHPTCGGLDQDCVLRCDTLWDNRARHDCFLQCAIDQGIRRGTRRWERVKRCNDKGSSRGPFQMKKGRIKQCKSKAIGMPSNFDPFDLAQSARCMMRVTRKVATSKRFSCGRVDNRWMVAHKRVTKGVRRTIAKAQPGRWVPDTRQGKVWVPPSEAEYEQICSESGYAKRGLRYYQACGKKCRQVERVQPKAKTVAEPAKALSFQQGAL
jgi:hypothetical protein